MTCPRHAARRLAVLWGSGEHAAAMTSATTALQARRVPSRRSTSTRAERSGGGHPYDQPARRWIARVRVGAGAHTPAQHLVRRACEPPTPSCLPHPNQVATRLRSIVTRGPPQPRARPLRRPKWVAFLVTRCLRVMAASRRPDPTTGPLYQRPSWASKRVLVVTPEK